MMKKNILCIDDVDTNLFTIQSVIEYMAEDQYNVLIAISALEGLKILLKEKIDLILLDVMMPEIDGFECAKIIKSNKKTKDIPIIFVTANNDDKTIETCFNVGGDDYINKPYNPTELLSRMRFHLKSREQDKLIMKEKEYTRSILDSQDNLVLVTDGCLDLTVNNAFLDFFSVTSIEEFTLKHDYLSHTFLEEEGYFSLALVKGQITWTEEVMKRSIEEDLLVKIKQDKKEYIFNLKAKSFSDQYIITLTDITQISQLSLEYKHEASHDSLTQIYNRHMFNRLIDMKMTQAKENANPLVFLLLDIDFFKAVNDNHGHLVGDDILKHLSRLIQSHTRENDLFARWGGEEFVLAFDVDLSKGLEIANHLREYIEKEPFHIAKKITCSFGITQFQGNDTLDSMILRADKALYQAKENGRNQVCHA